MSEIDYEEVGRQLRKPEGDFGKAVGEEMNSSNASLYELVFSMLELKEDENILEIGFGNGKFFKRYMDINPSLKVTGIDYSDIMCDEARVNNKGMIDSGRVEIICGNFKDAELPERSFDKIVGINTIYFWDNMAEYLQKAKYVLKENGQFVIGYRPKSFMDLLPFTQTGFTKYEPGELNKILKENGFNIINEKSTEHFREVMGSEIKFTDICVIAGR